MKISGYYLDDKTIVSPGIDSEGNTKWWLITFTKEIVDGFIQLDQYGEKFFDMKEIDPNDFEWSGMRLKINLMDDDNK